MKSDSSKKDSYFAFEVGKKYSRSQSRDRQTPATHPGVFYNAITPN